MSSRLLNLAVVSKPPMSGSPIYNFDGGVSQTGSLLFYESYSDDTGLYSLVKLNSASGVATTLFHFNGYNLDEYTDGDFVYAITSDGGHVVYEDIATSGLQEVYIRSTSGGSPTLVSATAAGVAGNGLNYDPAVSGNGNLVVFASNATNLDARASNGHFQVYLKNLSTNALTLVSANGAGNASDSVQSTENDGYAAISPDGTLVAFTLQASNLVAGVNADHPQIYVKNLSDGTIVVASQTANGTLGNSYSATPSFAADDRSIAFHGKATNLGSSSGVNQVYVKDLVTDVLIVASSTKDGTVGNGDSNGEQLSNDGRFVLFQSHATNLAAGTDAGTLQVYVKDIFTGELTLLSQSPATGVAGNQVSSTFAPQLQPFSADDTKVVFNSRSTNFGEHAGQITAIFQATLSVAAVTASTFTIHKTSLDLTAGGFAVDDTAVAIAGVLGALAGDAGARSIALSSGSGATSQAAVFNHAATIDLRSATLTLSGALSLVAGTVVTGSGNLFTSGSDTIGGFVLGGTASFRNQGTLAQSGGVTIGDSGPGAAQIINATGATWTISGDAGIGAGNALASFDNSGGALSKGSGSGISVLAPNFTNTGGTVASVVINSGTLNFTGVSNSFVNQAISGAGTFAIGGGGASTISGGTTIATSSWTIGKVGTTVTLGQNLTYAGSFSDTNQTVLNLGANTLTLSGAATFNLGVVGSPIIAGTGKLITSGTDTLGAFTLGGSVLFRSNGTVNQIGTITLGDSSNGAAQFTNAPGKTWSIQGDYSIVAGNSAAVFNNGGATLAKASGTGTSVIGTNVTNLAGTAATISIASGILNFTGATNSFVADAISGAGTFAIGGGGTSTIGAGTSITTASWTIAKVGTTVTLGTSLTYAGNFSQTNQTTLNLGANTLTLSGPALFNLGPGGSPIIAGTGKLITNGADSLGAFTLGGSVLLRNNGGVTQTGNITLGDSSNGAAQVTNAAGKSWVLTADIGIVKGSTAALFNTGGGGFSKTGGTGVSTIGVNVINANATTSQIEVASGTLDFAGTVSGAQAFKIDAGRTLQFDSSVATGSAVTFAGAGGTLRLNDAQDFKGAITGFGSGQSLDLGSIGFASPGTTLVYAGSTLTVVGGGKTASLAIGTGYTSTSFHLANDTHGGSLVTYG